MPQIIFLDLARRAGWAAGDIGGGVASGSVVLGASDASHGAQFARLDAWLADLIAERQPSVVAFEQPMDPRHMGSRSTFKTARALMGFTAIAEACCHRNRVPRVYECAVRDVRKHLLGKQPAKGKAKEEVMTHLRYLGWRPEDDNEADAVAGWLYMEAILAPEAGARRLPVFSRVSRGDR